MSKHLLTCECGKKVPVDIGQAGGQVTCSCGQQLNVPTLRNLKQLPAAETPASAGATRAPWNIKKGFVAAGLILAALVASYAAWNHYSEPVVPQFDPSVRSAAVEKGLEKMTPTESWDLWVQVYRPLADKGFGVFEYPHKAALEEHIAQRRVLQATLLIVAAVLAITSLCIAYFWPKQGM
jgi:hypothetical protein